MFSKYCSKGWFPIQHIGHCSGIRLSYSLSAAAPNFRRGQTYIVTGGASGIGLAVTKKLLDISAVVHVLDLQDRPVTLVRSNNGPGKLYFYSGVDVSCRQSLRNAFQKVFAESCEVAGLVNCAGIDQLSHEDIESDSSFDRVMAVNTCGVWNAVTLYMQQILDKSEQQASSPLGKGERGSIVNVGSSASVRGFPRLASYCASKHAIVGLTRSWSQTYAAKGVRVNCIAPGFVDTPLLRNRLDDNTANAGSSFSEMVPMNRFAAPEEVAEVVLFLLSRQASYISGQVIPVNGGWH
jgi:NAD(P)-dependent dehydrogenase (short-subunit alcohol dehydrogenase family)